MTWEVIAAGEARKDDRAQLGDKIGIVEYRYSPPDDLDRITITFNGRQITLDIYAWEELGAVFEREVPDRSNGLIPDVDWAHIVLGDGRHAVRTQLGAVRGWDWILQDGRYELRVSQKTIQEYADEHGFEVLWPKPSAAITDEMVERVASAHWEVATEVMPSRVEWDGLWDVTKNDHREKFRRVLEAALGGEQ